jgi:hypothetical protein
MIIMNFWNVRIGPFSKGPFEMNFLFVKFLMPNGYIIEISKLFFIFMNFMGFF